MMVRVYWLIRVTGFAVIGILALISPPHSATQQAVQIACFAVVGLALLAWIAVDVRPRYRARGLPVALCRHPGPPAPPVMHPDEGSNIR